MKKIGFIIFGAALLAGVLIASFTSFGGSFIKKPFSFSFGSKIHGSGNVKTEIRNTEKFNAIDIGGNLAVKIVQADEISVVVEADDNILPLIKTEVEGGVLRIGSESKFKSSRGVKILVSAPSIEVLDTSGVAKAEFTRFDGKSLRINTSGASKVSVTGVVENLEIEMSGASRVNAKELKTERANIEGSGASLANVNVAAFLNADLSGASSVNYTGSPAEIKKSVTGAADIKNVN